MSLLKDILTQIAVKKVQEAINGKSEEKPAIDNQSNHLKEPIFYSGEEFLEFLFSFSYLSQFAYVLILVFFQIESLSLTVLLRSYSMAVLISCIFFIILAISYGLYQIDALPLLFMLAPLLLLAVFFLCMQYGLGAIKTFFLGSWMNSLTQIVLAILGIAVSVLLFVCLCSFESSSQKNSSKNPLTVHATNAHNSEEYNKTLLKSIKHNSITIVFPKKCWGFEANDEVIFGINKKSFDCVFVNTAHYHIINHEDLVFLDYEEIPIIYPKQSSQHLIKLYCLDANRDEQIFSFWGKSTNSYTSIEKIHQFSNKYHSENDEAIFRRKIRHIASGLNKTIHLNRPFLNDKWFDILQNTMEVVYNSRTNGYILFRQKVIVNDHYENDSSLLRLICDMSQDPPDITSATYEARELIRQDSRKLMKENVKASVKHLFSKKPNR